MSASDITSPQTATTAEQPSRQFIADQRILRLNLTAAQRENTLEYLKTENLADPDQSLTDEDDQRRQRYAGFWQPVQNRLQYLTDAGPVVRGVTGQRLCVTTLAGIGKSKLVQQLAVVRAHLARAQVVLSGEELEFQNLPNNVDQYLSQGSDSNSQVCFLVQQVRRRLFLPHAGLSRLPTDAELQRWLMSQARSGHLTLVIDGLDEVPVVEGRPKARALAEFLQRFPRVHCVVAGRPYAIYNDYWATLFARVSGSPASDWEFCQTEVFTEVQRERYLGAARLQQLRQYRGRMELNGRTLEVLRILPDAILSSIRSIADVYWHSIEKSIRLDSRESAEQRPQTELTGDQSMAILSAIAILTVQGWRVQEDCSAVNELGLEPLPESADDSTTKDLRRSVALTNAFLDQLDQLVARALKLSANGAPDTSRARKLYHEFLRLSSAYVEFSYVNLQGETGRWRDVTCRDFFAALWLVRYSEKPEREWITQRPTSIRRRWSGSFISGRHSELLEVWQFLCGMPSVSWKNFDQNSQRWSTVIGSLFLPGQNSEPRPTELMALAWPALLRQAGFLQRSNWDDADLQAATVTIQQAVATSHQKNTWPLLPGNKTCQNILRTFLLEYLRYRDARGPVGNAETAAICEEDLESQFRDCQSFPGRTFYAGDRKNFRSGPATEMSLAAGFQLCSVPVTRRLYALFDPRHAGQHSDYDQFSPEPRCPAIYLSYWDSVMFSVWAHGRLPTEWEWEYASRGGQDRAGNDKPIYWWGNDQSQLVEYAWVRDNSGDRTHPVGQKTANGFELRDMLGNVWEWTSSRYNVTDSTIVSRVVRGGSFLHDAVLARCSRRVGSDPSDSNHDTGCRVARAEIRKP
jgi:formylglycine-generating enzyme required for sulfatase activity